MSKDPNEPIIDFGLNNNELPLPSEVSPVHARPEGQRRDVVEPVAEGAAPSQPKKSGSLWSWARLILALLSMWAATDFYGGRVIEGLLAKVGVVWEDSADQEKWPELEDISLHHAQSMFKESHGKLGKVRFRGDFDIGTISWCFTRDKMLDGDILRQGKDVALEGLVEAKAGTKRKDLAENEYAWNSPEFEYVEIINGSIIYSGTVPKEMDLSRVKFVTH